MQAIKKEVKQKDYDCGADLAVCADMNDGGIGTTGADGSPENDLWEFKELQAQNGFVKTVLASPDEDIWNEV
ncbi:MAG: hypothetical protein GXP59_07550 [Deltaproteobacteria bacterium]|nr:hypothetical protein [Deltaproteobacteria bacterium]